jgi:TatD DNase family protein
VNPQPDLESSTVAGMLVDTHCHLFLMDGEPATVVAAARAAGVTALVCVGIDATSSRRSRELADSISGVFATAGLHPHSAEAWDARVGSEIEQLLADPRVVAVGETGLDHYRMLAPAEDQERVFRFHCALARETGKPLVVHTREAWPDVLRVLAEERAERVVLHCFSGGEAEVREAAARGYLCSFAGNLTYPRNEGLRRSVSMVPEEFLLLETDSPFLAPQALRGRDNAPANVRLVGRGVAEALGRQEADVAALTTANARRAFGLPEESDQAP